MSKHTMFSTACRFSAPRNSSPALTFLQQFRRPLSSNSAPTRSAESIPLFLLPARTIRYNHRSQLQAQSRTTIRQKFARQQSSSFTTTAINRATAVIQNPQVDEDGKPLVVKISPRAEKRLRQITDPATTTSATQNENPYHHLRITVTSGGCHGFQYLMSLEPGSKISQEEDTVFEADSSEETEAPSSAPASGQAKVAMDSASLELLSGSTVDYTTELIGSQFKIVDNPGATSSCGCGTSFDVKD